MAASLALVVPCYNEAARLHLPAFTAFIDGHPGVSICFVDDGSTDATPVMLEEACAGRRGAMRVVHTAQNLGKGEAVRAGMLDAIASRPEFVGFWDADLSTPLDAVDDFLRAAGAMPEIEVFLGSRVLLMGRQIHRTAWRHYLGRIFATGASLALDLPVYDTQCGAKLFRANEALAAVLTDPFRNRWVFDVELLARYLRVPVRDGGRPRADRIYEVAVRSWREVEGSRLRLLDYVRASLALWPIWRGRSRRV